ncbi:hypothetical protein AB0I28_16810 [Phytomonospora sp. NPDC050363]|uniref:SMP-30/gluconolactonase/LRE family protein n=1 Tax=Phytomonospora sp. NPDC050363 TaxID=3155642 RepID=UPI003411F5D8
MRYVIPGEAVFPEGVTEAPDGRGFFVSGSADGTIFRGELGGGDLTVWGPAGSDGRDSALGMTVDPHGRLLVCGGKSGVLFAYDLATGALAARRPVGAEPTLLNDVCVLDGHAYVTDSLRPVVWRFALAPDSVGPAEEYFDLTPHDPGDAYLNGIVPTRDGTGLYAAAQGTGELWRLDPATRAAARVDLGGVPVNGDGMVWVDDVLYVCDNTDEPDGSARYWLTALHLADDGRSGVLAGRWERTVADTPTTVAYVGGRLLLVNSQFGARREGTAKAPFTVSEVGVPLPAS